MSTKTANPHQTFLDSRVGKYFLTKPLVDIDLALANAKRLQATSAAKGGSGKEVASWKRDTAQLKRQRADFVACIKDIKSGAAPSLDALEESYADAGVMLEWVEQRNHAYQMLHDAQVDVKVAAMMPILGLMTADGSMAILQKRKLELIMKDLQVAQKATKSKTAKAALTSLLVIAGTLLPPLGVAGTVFAITASIVASDLGGRAIDYAVGEATSPPDKFKTAYTAADTCISSAAQSNKAADALSKKSAAVGVVWDTADAGYAVYKQKKLEKRMTDLVKEVKASSAQMAKRAKKMKALQKEALASLQKARSTAQSFRSSKAARDKVRKDFKIYHNMN